MLRSEETVTRALPTPLWTKNDMDDIFSAHVGPIPRVRLVNQTNTKNNSFWSSETCHREKVDHLKRKRDNDDDKDVDDEVNGDETDSHREQRRLVFDRNNRVNNSCSSSKIFKYDENYAAKEEETEASERELWTIVSMYKRANKWKIIAKRLGLKKHEIEEIRVKQRKQNDTECLYQCLVKHRQHSDKPLRVESVLEVFKIPQETYNKKLEDIQNSISSISSSLKSEMNMRKPLSELDLWRISELIWANWKPMSRILGLGEHQISYIEDNHADEGARECAYQALLLLNPMSIETLMRALIELGLNYFARKLIQIVSMSPALIPF